MDSIKLMAVKGLPLIQPGDHLPKILAQALTGELRPQAGDILVLAQKIVSKAEGAIVNLATVQPSAQAIQLAQQTGRDPRLCQVYLNEASEVIAVKGRMVITRHKLGFVGSSSGVDRSNVAPHAQEDVVLLPRDPDGSARAISHYLQAETGHQVAVIINDSCGRDYRDGSVGMAIGVAGMAILERRDQTDLFGNSSRSGIALLDEVAAAASILMGQGDEGIPAVLVRGVAYTIDEHASIRSLLN